jgi:uracil-DNA glycosylase
MSNVSQNRLSRQEQKARLQELKVKLKSCHACSVNSTQKIFGAGKERCPALLFLTDTADGRSSIVDFAKKNYIDQDSYHTSVIKCHPAEITKETINSCRSYCIQQIKLIEPTIIVTIGTVAARVVMGDDFIITSETNGRLFRSKGGREVFVVMDSVASFERELFMELNRLEGCPF